MTVCVIFVCKVHVWNVNCAQATALIYFRLTACGSVDVVDTENVSICRSLESPTLGFLLKQFELSQLDISYLLFWNTGSGGIDIVVCVVCAPILLYFCLDNCQSVKMVCDGQVALIIKQLRPFVRDITMTS